MYCPHLPGKAGPGHVRLWPTRRPGGPTATRVDRCATGPGWRGLTLPQKERLPLSVSLQSPPHSPLPSASQAAPHSEPPHRQNVTPRPAPGPGHRMGQRAGSPTSPRPSLWLPQRLGFRTPCPSQRPGGPRVLCRPPTTSHRSPCTPSQQRAGAWAAPWKSTAPPQHPGWGLARRRQTSKLQLQYAFKKKDPWKPARLPSPLKAGLRLP